MTSEFILNWQSKTRKEEKKKKGRNTKTMGGPRNTNGTYTIVFFEYPKRDYRTVQLGQRFGNVTAEAYLGMDARRRCVYRWRCDCGRTFEALGSDIKLGRKNSCGYCEFGPKKKTLSKRKPISTSKPFNAPIPQTEDIDPNDTLCWHCKHAHGKPENQCKWARRLKPIEGWTAESVILKGSGHQPDFESYHISECPGFVREYRGEHSVKSSEWDDRAVNRLVAAYIKMAIEDYEKALKRCKRVYKKGESLMYAESDALWELYGFFFKGSPMINGINLTKLGRLTEKKMGMPEWLKEYGLESVSDLILAVDWKGEEQDEIN